MINGMKGSDILRIVDALHREKGVDKEIIFGGIEAALLSAAKKKLGMEKNIVIEINRETGDIVALDDETPIDNLEDLGRIAALTAKQVMIQKIREAERDVVYDEYIHRVGTLVNGTVQRFERPNVIVSLGKSEGIIPWREQVPGETYNPGERIKCLVLEVRKVGQRVRIVLSRAHPDLLRHLFALEVPEIAERIIEIKDLARDAGHRAKVAVQSIDHKVDCVGACVGIRGSRIKNIVDELNGEKIDIVRWNDSQEVYIMNSMKPAMVNAIELEFEDKTAKVFVEEDQLSLAIGRRGQNVRLASRLTGWAIDLVTGTPDAYEERFQVDYDSSRERQSMQQSAAEQAAAILPEGPAEGENAEASDADDAAKGEPEPATADAAATADEGAESDEV